MVLKLRFVYFLVQAAGGQCFKPQEKEEKITGRKFLYTKLSIDVSMSSHFRLVALTHIPMLGGRQAR